MKIYQKLKLIAFASILVLIVAISSFVVGKIKTKKNLNFCNEYYYVFIGGFDRKFLADQMSNNVQNKGASGYLIADNEFKVLIFLYEKKSDANRVVQDLIKGGYEAQSDELKINTLSRKANKIIKKDKSFLKLINFFPFIYNSVYDITVEFDKAEIFESEVYTAIKKLLSSINSKIFHRKEDSKISDVLFESLENIKKEFTYFLKELDVSSCTASELKSLCFKIIFEYNEMINNINQLYI